ncbi:MAG TPA: hypothetical protein VJ904_07000 [Tichowtungia sp.]|nr:hypothetical protein [Tichowtungia sp.]
MISSIQISPQFTETGPIDGNPIDAAMDRAFIDESGTRWIIDYKSGYREGGDVEDFLAEEAARYGELREM